MNKCLLCEKPLDSLKARFCSDAHRKAYSRKQDVKSEIKVKVKMEDTSKISGTQMSVRTEQKNKNLTWTQADIDNWKVGDKAFWPSEVENPHFMPNWVRSGHRTKREALAHVLDTLQANRERILSHGLDGEITFTVGNDSFELKGKKEKTKKGTQTLEVKKPEEKKVQTELDWDKPGAIPVVCGVCKQLKEQTVYVKYTDVNGADSEPVFLCPEDFKRLQDHQRKAGGTITHLERKDIK